MNHKRVIVFVLACIICAALLLVCLGGCHLHLHVGERHTHRTNPGAPGAKAANVLDDILERLDNVQEDMGDKDVSTNGSRHPNGASG